MTNAPAPDDSRPVPPETSAETDQAAPRAKLTIKKQDHVTDTATTGLAATHRPVRPVRHTTNNLGLIFAVLVTAAIGAAGWYGFRNLEELKDRRGKAESEHANAVRERELLRVAADELRTKIARTPDDTRAAILRAESTLTDQLRAAAEQDFKALAEKLAEAQTKAAELRLDAQKQREAAQIELDAAQKAAEAALKKVAAIEKENAEMKAWLNTHHKSMHPRY